MQIIINPREARRFAQFLDERAQELKTLNRRISSELVELGKSAWRDKKYDHFLRQFDEASVLLQIFLEHAEKYANYLRSKAAPIERYLGSGR